MRKRIVDDRKLTEHRVEKETVSTSDIIWKFRVEQLGLSSLLVSLNQDLSYPDSTVRVPTRVSQ